MDRTEGSRRASATRRVASVYNAIVGASGNYDWQVQVHALFASGVPMDAVLSGQAQVVARWTPGSSLRILDIACGHAHGVQRQNLLVETGEAALMLRDQVRLEGAVAIARRVEIAASPVEIAVSPGTEAEVAVLDVQPADRHLLLLIREGRQKSKFLCGHDERHWFIAGIPENAPVGTVRQAKEALKPIEVQDAQASHKIKAKARNRRKNAAYIRQGEWFFLPAPGFVVDERLILNEEPLTRGLRGKPHWAAFCYRTGGETVYMCSRHSSGVTAAQYRRILAGNPNAVRWGWQSMRRNPGVYVRGRIRHPDHKTITLHDWHRVVRNTESQSKAMRNVAFLD